VVVGRVIRWNFLALTNGRSERRGAERGSEETLISGMSVSINGVRENESTVRKFKQVIVIR